jgi:periplasmic protein CpxP/Spy
MSAMSYRLFHSAHASQVVGIAALMGAAFFAAPLSAQPQVEPAAMQQSDAQSPAMVKETVEQRISNLHMALQITPGQEADWANVAQTMRDNDAVMQDMAAQRKAVDPASITAVEDLRWYEKFAKAHVTGLRKLIVSFETLYGSMPNAQKGVADHVFKSFGRPETRASN